MRSGGNHLELAPGEKLRYTDKFDDPNMPGEMEVTVTLKKVSVGTELDVVQAGKYRTLYLRRHAISAGGNRFGQSGKARRAGNQRITLKGRGGVGSTYRRGKQQEKRRSLATEAVLPPSTSRYPPALRENAEALLATSRDEAFGAFQTYRWSPYGPLCHSSMSSNVC